MRLAGCRERAIDEPKRHLLLRAGSANSACERLAHQRRSAAAMSPSSAAIISAHSMNGLAGSVPEPLDMAELPHAADLVGAVLRLAETCDVDDDLKPRLRPDLPHASPLLALAEP